MDGDDIITQEHVCAYADGSGGRYAVRTGLLDGRLVVEIESSGASIIIVADDWTTLKAAIEAGIAYAARRRGES